MSQSIPVKKIAQLTGHEASIFALSPGENPRCFYSGAGDGWIVRWDLEQPDLGKLVAKVETQIFSLLFLTGTDQIVAGNMNGGVHWVNLSQPDLTRNIAHHQKGVFGLGRAGEYLYSVGGGGLLTRWSIAERRTLESIQLTNQSLRCLAYDAIRKEIAVGASDNAIYLLDEPTLSLKQVFTNAHDNSVFSLCYHPNGKYLLSGGRDAYLRVWDLENNGKVLSAQPAHWFTLNQIEFSPSQKWFATASRDKTVKIWDATDFTLRKVLTAPRDAGHLNSVNCLHWAAFHDLLISGGDDRSMIIWSVQD